MANNPLPKPYFPVPPTQYDPAYFREVTKIFSVFLQQASNPGKVTADGLNLKPLGQEGCKFFLIIHLQFQGDYYPEMCICYLQENLK